MKKRCCGNGKHAPHSSKLVCVQHTLINSSIQFWSVNYVLLCAAVPAAAIVIIIKILNQRRDRLRLIWHVATWGFIIFLRCMITGTSRRNERYDTVLQLDLLYLPLAGGRQGAASSRAPRFWSSRRSWVQRVPCRVGSRDSLTNSQRCSPMS